MKDFLRQFREFAVKGNAVELAIGIVIGTAFSKIVSSLVADVITPVVGFFFGGGDFGHLALHLKSPIPGGEDTTVNYGLLIQSILDFIIIAFVLFLVIKGMTALKKRMKREEAAGIVKKPEDIVLLEQIRDLLKDQKGSKVVGKSKE